MSEWDHLLSLLIITRSVLVFLSTAELIFHLVLAHQIVVFNVTVLCCFLNTGSLFRSVDVRLKIWSGIPTLGCDSWFFKKKKKNISLQLVHWFKVWLRACSFLWAAAAAAFNQF